MGHLLKTAYRLRQRVALSYITRNSYVTLTVKWLSFLVQQNLLLLTIKAVRKSATKYLTVLFLAWMTVQLAAGDVVANWDPHSHPIITERAAKISFADIDDSNTEMQQDELTGLTRIVVKDLAKVNSKEPKLILESDEFGLQEIRLPSFTTIEAKEGKVANEGDVLARIPQESSKTRDITGGLPRVADLFEARKPKEPAILAEISGTIGFGKETKGKKRLVITPAEGDAYEEMIPKWRQLNVFEVRKWKKAKLSLMVQSLHTISYVYVVS